MLSEQELYRAINEIADQICSAVDGDFNFVVTPESNDETIQKLGMLINFLLDSSRRALTDIAQARDELDEKVQERTKALEVQKERAEAANRAKSRFLANMSHEVRTPMNGVLGLLQCLKRTELSSKQLKYVDASLSSADSLLRVLNDVLDFSRVEAGMLPIERVEFDLREELTSIMALTAASMKSTAIFLETDIAESVPRKVYGDSNRLRQIISNLLQNAIKFTESGFVTLRVMTGSSSRHDRTALVFEVSDSGVGMDENELQRIFHSFTQADDSTTRKYGGTGLGLTISKQLVELMGGKIGVKSTKGEGSTFTFQLDFEVCGDSGVSAERGSHVIGETLDATKEGDTDTVSKPKVLLVEDNEINRLVALDMLEDYNLDVHVAENGQEAVDAVNRETYDLVLMDCQMPVMDGYEAVKIIRSNEKAHFRKTGQKQHITIAAVTANAFDSDRERCFEIGMDEFISKPYSMDDLDQLISKYIDPNITGDASRY